MKTLNIPEGYQRVMPYLIVKNAPAFIQFTKNVFDAEEKHITMRDEKLIMHAEISIGGSCIMFADATDQFKEQTTGLFIYMEDCDSIYQKALDNGAVNVMEPADQSYGRSAGVRDPFGNTWWITGV
ncbi:MAG TPA: VOC family protein [Mucilaginibacter sp.]|nr:VOC family protein [Mucilaginibacter sp.]